MEQRTIKISASIACGDFRNLQDLVNRLENLRLDYIH